MIKIRAGLSDIYAQAYQGKSCIAKKYREYTERINSDRLSWDEKCKVMAERQIIGEMMRELDDVMTSIRGKQSPAYIHNLRELKSLISLGKLSEPEKNVVKLLLSGMSQEKVAKRLRMHQWNVSKYCNRAIEKLEKVKKRLFEAYTKGLYDVEAILYVNLTEKERIQHSLQLDGKKDIEIAELMGVTITTVQRRQREIQKKRNDAENWIKERRIKERKGMLLTEIFPTEKRMPLNQIKGQTKQNVV